MSSFAPAGEWGSGPPCGGAGTGQGGVALVAALMLVMLVTTLIGALVPVMVVERGVAASLRDGLEAAFLAEAGLELAQADLQRRTDWSAVLAGAAGGAWTDSTVAPRLFDGRRLDLSAETARLQAETAAASRWLADTPQWRLFVWGPAASLDPALVPSRVHVAVWVADDERDGDGDPTRDTNGRLLLASRAFGPRGVERRAEAAVTRVQAAPAPLRRDDWRVP
jgi:hypothetical protein